MTQSMKYRAAIEETGQEKTTQLFGPSATALTTTLKKEFAKQQDKYPSAVLRVYKLSEELVEEHTSAEGL